MVYVYPKFPAAYCTPLARIGGSGLANCLFIYARAIMIAKKYNLQIIAPTWFNLSLGTYIRHQSDKRHYLGLFNNKGEVCGIKRLFLLSTYKKISESDKFSLNDNAIIVVEGLCDFFSQFISSYKTVSEYILGHIVTRNLMKVQSFDFSNCVAVHIRLGDYSMERRIPEEWFINTINNYCKENPTSQILLFSDGTDSELRKILSLPNVKRVFFGNSIADIVAISKCEYLIGSDSTFSAWGAFLGQVPCHYYRLKSSPVLSNANQVIIDNL